jgi:uncharacterized protein (TIGR00369 family)
VLQAVAADKPLLDLLGIEFASAADGVARLETRVLPALVNAAGFAHGGIAYSLADIACAYALSSTGRRGVTLDAHVTYLKGATAGTHLVAVASLVSQSRRIASLRAEVHAGDVLIAHGMFTFMLVEPRESRI